VLLRLRLPRRALERGGRLRARISVVGVDSAGNADVVRLSATIRR
jgi:hypothetical protein